MAYGSSGRIIRVGLVGVAFAAGFLCGSVTQRRADAQLGDFGGAATKLGEAIVDMQKNVDGLQKNIDVLKKVKSSLGG